MKAQATTTAKALAVALVIAATTLDTCAETREFTDVQGRKLEGEIIAVAGGQVQIKRAADAKLFALPVTQFSEADQKTFAAFAAANVKHSFDVKFAKSKLGETKIKTGDVARETERWAYKVALRNLSSVDADNVRIDYWLFRRIDNGNNKSAPRVDVTGSLKVENIRQAATYEFTTEPVELKKTKLDANFYYADGRKSKSSDSIGGLALRIFKGDKEIYAFGTDKDLLGAAKGSASSASASDEAK
jgi:hypothetical protein